MSSEMQVTVRQLNVKNLIPFYKLWALFAFLLLCFLSFGFFCYGVSVILSVRCGRWKLGIPEILKVPSSFSSSEILAVLI